MQNVSLAWILSGSLTDDEKPFLLFTSVAAALEYSIAASDGSCASHSSFFFQVNAYQA